jgi:hypothetical protein
MGDDIKTLSQNVTEAAQEYCLAFLPRHKLDVYRTGYSIWTLIDYVYAKEQIFNQHVSPKEVKARDSLIRALSELFRGVQVPLSDMRRVMHNACKPAVSDTEQALKEAMKGG